MKVKQNYAAPKAAALTFWASCVSPSPTYNLRAFLLDSGLHSVVFLANIFGPTCQYCKRALKTPDLAETPAITSSHCVFFVAANNIALGRVSIYCGHGYSCKLLLLLPPAAVSVSNRAQQQRLLGRLLSLLGCGNWHRRCCCWTQTLAPKGI